MKLSFSTKSRRKFLIGNLEKVYCACLILCLSVVAATAQEEVIWQQSHGTGAGGVSDFGPSQKAGSTAYTLDQELADDINLTGTINRIEVHGYTNGPSSPTPASTHYFGVNVRFYAVGADDKPGALQAEYFVPKTSPNMIFQGSGLGDLRVRLEPAFQATGRHFIAVQAVLDPIVVPGSGGSTAKWYWRSDNAEPIREIAPWFRQSPSAPWIRDEDNDGSRNLSLRIWGTRILNTPPVISNLSKTTLPQAGRLKITGTNFGTTQGTGTVRINGAIAPVSKWTETLITAYVSDSSTVGAGSVEVITTGGTSNSLPFAVTPRPPANGRVKWRFQADDLYIQGRAAVGTDGTIYAADVGGHLYALTPDGGLKWIYRGKFPVVQSVSVGADNTAYFTGGNVIYAINADGSLKWQITNPTGAGVAAGPNVGPDGNIYAVFDVGSTTNPQLGALTISPAGQILNDRPGYLEPRGGAYGNREIVFGSNQFYFGGLNNFVFNTTGLEFFQFGGNYIRTVMVGGSQPAIAPDGTVYNILGANPGSPPRLAAFSPSGALLRTILTAETYLSTPDIGADGTIYAAHNLTTLSGYTPAGAKLWDFSPNGSVFGSAIVNPQNTVVTVSGYDYAEPGVIYGVSNTGQSLWTINLTPENGGYIRAMSRARFTPDGSTVYYGTDVNDYANDVYSYLYAIAASPSLPCSFGITPDSAAYQYNGGSGSITIAATNANCVWTVTSSANWVTVHNGGGTGNGTVTYTVTANPNFTTRTGTITIGGRVFTITQAARVTATEVRITYPVSGEAFILPTNTFIAANATEATGTVNRVEFYANLELIGTDTSAPYQIAWNDPAATEYTLIAKSFAQNGAETLSEAVTISINPVPPPEPAPLPIPPPTLTKPTANQEFISGDNVTFEAIPGASQYPVEKMEFYLGTTLVGEDETSPYTFVLNNIPAGSHTVSARTVAGTGARANSQPTDIRVNAERISKAAKPFDFDGDGKADVSVFRPSNGIWYLDNSQIGFTATQWGISSDTLVPGDYDGDDKIDLAVFRRSANSTWYIVQSQTNTFRAVQWGATNQEQQLLLYDRPVPADYDGDGKTDFAVWRLTDHLSEPARFFILQSLNGTARSEQWGKIGDVPVAADYDGDGKADLAVFRSGIWYVLKSTNNNMFAVNFGLGDDKLIPADYDGDGKTDFAVFRPSNGVWYLLRSRDGFLGYKFGLGDDKLVPADYDGDGKTDFAVYRNGIWYFQKSTQGFGAIQFGLADDKPIPNAFVP